MQSCDFDEVLLASQLNGFIRGLTSGCSPAAVSLDTGMEYKEPYKIMRGGNPIKVCACAWVSTFCSTHFPWLLNSHCVMQCKSIFGILTP